MWLASVETQIHVDTVSANVGADMKDARSATQATGRHATVTDGAHELTSGRNRQLGVAVPATLVAAPTSVRTVE